MENSFTPNHQRILPSSVKSTLHTALVSRSYSCHIRVQVPWRTDLALKKQYLTILYQLVNSSSPHFWNLSTVFGALKEMYTLYKSPELKKKIQTFWASFTRNLNLPTLPLDPFCGAWIVIYFKRQRDSLTFPMKLFPPPQLNCIYKLSICLLVRSTSETSKNRFRKPKSRR